MLKLMNGLYGVSLTDNAVNTQGYLSKIILFLKYYTSDEDRLVKLKDEFAMIGLFGEMMTTGTGIAYNVTVDIRDEESRNLYIPTKSLLLLALDILVFRSNMAQAQGNLIIDAYNKENVFFISFTCGDFSDIGRIHRRTEEIKKAFENALGPGVRVALSSAKKDFLEIGIILMQA